MRSPLSLLASIPFTPMQALKPDRLQARKSKVKLVAKMLKAIHAQESKKAAREKVKAVIAELRTLKLRDAAKKIEDGVEETLTYFAFPSEHWTRIRTTNAIERLNR